MTIEATDRLVDTVTDTAHRLGLSRTGVYAQIKAGKLRAVKAGGKTLITRDDQAAWVASLSELKTAVGA
ncbi:hypothetical protein ASD67_00145 [Sphingopyxis sp. Root1497]|uniref:helix-turn-helix domain-containing protein n=1 Tax=Sphingopyxis sp. Root1497 TaxID=1736474 RepID=UPI0006F730CE|nr:helix-turn-helix domain-containing protein [Sphingopyxis sp. Root1497]KQZ65566.1 hypothetical protein ASD67_00145 [Sphingopyxis sp. Root1497]